ncbi:MAG: ABC transporter permease [Clostridiaceae bacterium]|nr:ABC transporter permease [Clostridiaceae bacterium]
MRKIETEKTRTEKSLNFDRRTIKERLSSIVPYVGLLFIVLFFQIVTKGQLLKPNNLRTVFNQLFTTFLGACGLSFVIAQGNLDLSLGSVAGFAAAVAGIIGSSLGLVPTILISLIIGTIIGMITGLIHVKFNAPATIVTICMQFLLRGFIAVLTLKGLFVPLAWGWMDSITVKVIVISLFFVVFLYMFEYTKLGKHSKAIGSAQLAAAQSGVRVDKMKIFAYVISGMVAGLCGFFMMIRAGSVAPTTGTSFEMDVLLAIVLGGMPLSGGSHAKIRAAFLGSITLAFLMNGLIVWGVSDTVQQGVKGAILLVSATLSYERDNMEIIK